MAELDIMRRAKDYIDKLANGIDPISGCEMSGDTVLNQVKLSRCFFYVSDVLNQVIENGGNITRVTTKNSHLPPFALPHELREKIEITKEPAMIKSFTERINNLVDLSAMRNLKVTAFTSWLVDKGYLYEEVVNGKKYKKPTQSGQTLGITAEWRDGQYSGYMAVLYSERAQQFLVDHLDEIIAVSNG